MKYTTIISGQDTQNKEWRLQCNSHDQYSQQQILLGLKFFFNHPHFVSDSFPCGKPELGQLYYLDAPPITWWRP